MLPTGLCAASVTHDLMELPEFFDLTVAYSVYANTEHESWAANMEAIHCLFQVESQQSRKE